MPRGDRTGPMGMGPMTGRRAGYCSLEAPGYANSVGFGGRFVRGRGFCRMLYATGTPGWARYGYPTYTGTNAAAAFDENAFLNNQAEFLENQLQLVKKRLSSLNEGAE